jgi:hypothetical protein
MATDSSRLLIRLRRIVGSNPTSGANLQKMTEHPAYHVYILRNPKACQRFITRNPLPSSIGSTPKADPEKLKRWPSAPILSQLRRRFNTSSINSLQDLYRHNAKWLLSAGVTQFNSRAVRQIRRRMRIHYDVSFSIVVNR